MAPPFPGMGGFFRGNPFGIATEGVYLVIIAAICLFIYFKTKESFELTRHQGIRYFRNAFLFFSLAFFFRFLFVIIHLYTIPYQIHLPREIMQAGLWLNAYASSMAIISLAFSTLWKRLPDKINWTLVMNAVSIAIMAGTFFTRSPHLLLLSQAALIAFAIFAIPNKKTSKVYLTYLLFLVAWALNFILIIIPRFSIAGRGIVYAAQVVLFIIILRKVIRATHHDKETRPVGSHL